MRPGSDTTRTIIWAGFMLAAFTATHLPPSSAPSVPWISDKILHFTGFFVIGIVTWWRFQPARPEQTLRFTAAMLAFLMLYALIDEWTQPLIGRSAEWSDWTADAAGACLGIGIGMVFTNLRRRTALKRSDRC